MHKRLHRIELGSFRHGAYELAYEIYGQSGPPVLLVHGLLLDAHVNRDLARALADEGFRVILLDLLGHGRSDKPPLANEHRIDFYAEQVVAALDHLRIERAIVGGVSLGAITALQTACQAPERVRGLFLEMPVMERATPAAALILVPLLLAVYYAAPIYRVFARGLRWLPRPQSDPATSVMNALSAEPETIAAVLHGILVGPVVPSRRARQEIQAPTLVIGHSRDLLHQLEDAKSLVKEIPNARLIEARSILELRLDPARLMPEIIAFMRSLPEDRDAVACLERSAQ